MSDPEKEAGKENKEPPEAWVQRLLEPRPVPLPGGWKQAPAGEPLFLTTLSH